LYNKQCGLLGLGTALKILFSKEVLSVDMFERNEILALIVTLGKYSDAIQFIEEMEQQIEINRLKANIQGFVDIDNERKEEKQNQDKKKETQKFEELIDKTFKRLFRKNDDFNSCQEWKVFCADNKMFDDDKRHNMQIADRICTLFQQYCA